MGNCGATYGGLTGKTKEDFGHGNARFIPYTNVFDNPLTDTKRLEAVEIDSSQNQVAYGDVLFTVSSETPDEVGMSSVWLSDQENVYLNSFCFGYRQDSTFDPHYLAYMLRSSSVRSNLALLAQGISRFNISKNKVMELTVPVPSAVEQKELGQYFTKLDHLITLHQCKCQHCSLCGYLSWEQRKFSDVFDFLRNNTLPRAELSESEGHTLNIHYGDILVKFGEVIDATRDALPRIADDGLTERLSCHSLADGDVIIADTAEDAAVGKCSELRGCGSERIVSGLHTMACRPKDEFAQGYLGYYLNSPAFHNQLLPLMQGIKVISVSKGAISDIDVRFPSLPEQHAIGQSLSSLDSLITLHR